MLAYLNYFTSLVRVFVQSNFWNIFVVPVFCCAIVLLSIYVIWQIISFHWR